MKKVTLQIKDHADRMQLLKALQNNGYECKVSTYPDYNGDRKVCFEFLVDDSEVK